MKLLIIQIVCCMFVMQHQGKASNAYKNNLNTGVVSFGKKYLVRQLPGCCNFHPSLFPSFPKMQHSEKQTNAKKQSNSIVTSNPRNGNSKSYPTIKFKKKLNYDIQKDCDALVLDCFYEWVDKVHQCNPNSDTILLTRLSKIRTRFIETI